MEPIAIEQDADNLLRIKNLAMTYDLMYIALDDLMWVAFTFDHVKQNEQNDSSFSVAAVLKMLLL